jgi:peroxiredoxin
MSNGARVLKGAILGSLLVISACAGAPPPSQPSPLLRRVMPTFEGDTLSRNHFYTAQGSGFPMVVKFFSSKCDRCKETLLALQRVYADSSDLIVVGISEDETAVEASRLVDTLGIHFPVILDIGGKVSKQYEVREIPATFVMTPNGSVSWVGGKEQTEDGVRAAIRLARK